MPQLLVAHTSVLFLGALRNGEYMKSVTSLSLRDDGLLALVKLTSGLLPVSKVTAKDDTALVRSPHPPRRRCCCARDGKLTGFAGTTVKSFSVLQPAQFSAGTGPLAGRWVRGGQGDADHGEVAASIDRRRGTVTPLLSSTDAPSAAIAGFDPDALWKSFGLPSMGCNGEYFAVAAVLQARKGRRR